MLRAAGSRLTEFLTTVGGVWQSIMVICIALWLLLSRVIGMEAYTYLAEPNPIKSTDSFKVDQPRAPMV